MTQDIGRFISRNIELADEAWRRSGGTEYFYRIGPLSLSVRHIGNSLVKTVGPALRHAIVDHLNDTVHGTIYTIDATALGMQKPPDTWPFSTDTHEDHQRIHWNPESGLALNSDETRGIWQLFNLKTSQGLYWVANESTLPSWETGSPLRIFLHWLAMQKGYQLIHAAGLEINGCGILLTGRGGSGKSTTTAAAVNAGWKTVGDDFVLLAQNNKPMAYCIYDTVKLTHESLARLDNMSGMVVNVPADHMDKSRVHLADYYRQQLVDHIPINMLFVLQITNAQYTSILSTSKAVMMNALAPTTMFMLKTGMKESFRKMSELVNNTDCYLVRMGSEPNEVVEKLSRFTENSGVQT